MESLRGSWWEREGSGDASRHSGVQPYDRAEHVINGGWGGLGRPCPIFGGEGLGVGVWSQPQAIPGYPRRA